MRSLVVVATKASLYLAISLGMTLGLGCSNNNQVVHKAPQSNEDLGFIVLDAERTQAESFLAQYPASQMRVLSEANGFYEFRHTQKSDLSQHFPGSPIHKNVFIQISSKSDSFTEVEAAFNSNHYEKASLALNKIQDKITATRGEAFDPESCKESNLKPVISVKPLSTSAKSIQELEVGDSVKLDGSQSQPHAFTGGDLKFSWFIMAPRGSNIEPLQAQTELDLEFDTAGVYQVLAVAQDKKSVCNLETLNLLVTQNEKYQLQAAPSKQGQEIAEQIYLEKLGRNRAHQKAPTKGEGVLIAIIDSGVNYNHPYLSANIFTNPNEQENGQDNDNNSLADDLHGWDFVNNDPYPFDDNGHGSHVAGLSAGKVFGVAPNAQILPIKTANAAGASDLASSLKATVYALEMGADIINMSFGSYRQPLDIEKRVLKLASEADALILAAAGNGNPSTGLAVDTDINKHLPSGLVSDNLISVGALNNKDQLTYYSNYGVKSVQVATYGGEDFDMQTRRPYDGQLFSAYIPNPQGLEFFPAQGTSMSTPVAAGIAALVRSLNPELNAAEVADILKNAGPKASQLQGKITSGRILTADSAVELTPTLDQLN